MVDFGAGLKTNDCGNYCELFFFLSLFFLRLFVLATWYLYEPTLLLLVRLALRVLEFGSEYFCAVLLIRYCDTKRPLEERNEGIFRILGI